MKTEFICQGCGGSYEANMSTPQFLGSLDIDQLYYCRDEAKKLIEKKQEEKKVTLWRVGDDMLNWGFFAEDDYDSAVACLREHMEDRIKSRIRLDSLSVVEVRVRESEVASHLELG